MTAVWASYIHRVIIKDVGNLTIGDCSGGFHANFRPDASTCVYRLLNYQYGQKLDLFIQKVCQAQFVMISDDDVFWVDEVPWKWALEQFTGNPNLAVVSLVPRQRFNWTLAGQVYQPMGSYCLIVRRDIWLKENLSFKPVAAPSPNPKSHKGQFDTADYANIELIRRGYQVLVAPQEIRDHLVVFKGISSGVIYLQKTSGDVRKYPEDLRNLFYVLEVGQKLRELAAEYFPHFERSEFLSPRLAQKAYHSLQSYLTESQRLEIRESVNQQFQKLVNHKVN